MQLKNPWSGSTRAARRLIAKFVVVGFAQPRIRFIVEGTQTTRKMTKATTVYCFAPRLVCSVRGLRIFGHLGEFGA